MDDVVLAQTLRTGGPAALANVYDRYARELYDYCLTFLEDRAAASTALHHALLVAVGWATWLDDPGRLRVWLYALTRNECLRLLADPAGVATRRAGAGAHSSRGLWARAQRNTRPEADLLREVFDLVHRHVMDDTELAAVLGTSVRRARALHARSEVAFAASPAALVPFRASLRPPAPADLRARVLESITAAGRTAHRADVAQPRRRSGFPVPLDRPGLPGLPLQRRATHSEDLPALSD